MWGKTVKNNALWISHLYTKIKMLKSFKTFFCIQNIKPQILKSLYISIILRFYNNIALTLERFIVFVSTIDIYYKLMGSNRGHAKIWSKLYSNRLLINFFDPNVGVQSIVATISIRFWSTIGQNRSIIIDNWLIYIENVIFFDINCRFRYKLSFLIK